MAFQNISSTRTDLDSPIDEDLMGDLADNDQYLFDSAVRGGEYTVPVRLAIARGRKATLTITVDINGNGQDTATITFASDAFDGDPKFDTAPVVTLSAEEMSTGDDLVGGVLTAWVGEGGSTTTTCPIVVGLRGGVSGNDVEVRVHWIAIAPVTPGE